MKTHYEMGIVRRFDFSSKLQRMSVIVKNVNEPYFKVYSKKNPNVKFKDWLKENGSEKNIPEKAPQAALDKLASDRSLAPAFKAKYGYLPEGY